MTPTLHLQAADWWALFEHFASLSLLAVGGAITTAPDMHRWLVQDSAWLSETQFTASIALAQAAPGPNILFVALMGWHVGLNSAGAAGPGATTGLALMGALVAMAGIMLPSSVLSYTATRWLHRHRHHRGVRAFKAGMAPVVIALLLSTAWLLTTAHTQGWADAPLVGLTLLSTLLVWRTRIHMLWLIALGAALGAWGWV